MEPNINVQYIHNMGYWCVVRDQQSNIIFNGNNFVLQNAHTNEVRYLEDTPENRQYLQLSEPQPEPALVLEEPQPALALEELPPAPVDLLVIKQCSKRPSEADPFWEKNKIKLLLTLCLENKFRNPNPNAKEKNLWSEMAPIIGTTAEECAKKYRNLRRTYIRLCKKKRQGKDIKWVYYNICEEIFHDSKMINPTVLEIWEDHKVRQLLTLYIENLNRFRDPDCLKKTVWNEIAQAMGTSEYNCYHKFKNLKRTYFNWMERNKQSGKHIKWQFYHYFERIFYNYNPSMGPWDRNKTKLLLTTYSRVAHKFRNPKFQKKELWKEIASTVNETPNNCDRKFRNLKQTYIKLKLKAESGRGTTNWRFYRDFDEIYSNNPSSSALDTSGMPVTKQTMHAIRYPEEDYVKQLLEFYLSNLQKFRNPLVKKKSLWKQVAPKLGISADDCDRKFRNLKQTYIRLSERKKETGKCNKWPYFTFFEQIYEQTDRQSEDGEGPTNDDCDNERPSQLEQEESEAREREESNMKFERLIQVVEESNNIQRERNRILSMLLERRIP